MMNAIVLERFSTLDQPSPVRLDSWNRHIGERFEGMTVAADQSINASWLQLRFGEVGVACARSEQALIDRHCDRSLGGPERLKLHIQHSGRSLTSQGDVSAMLLPGDMAAIQTHRPYKMAISDRNQMFVLDCAVDALRLTGTPLNDLGMRRIEGTRAPVAILRQFITSVLHQTWEADQSEEDGQALGDVILRLIGRCLAAPASVREKPEQCARERVLGLIDERLNEPDLRTGMIADTLSLSRRTVQGVFAAMATTPTAYIQARRLAAAAEKLNQSGNFGSITDLAFDLGFSDSAYFCRCFKAQFGMSPSGYRRRVKA